MNEPLFFDVYFGSNLLCDECGYDGDVEARSNQGVVWVTCPECGKENDYEERDYFYSG